MCELCKKISVSRHSDSDFEQQLLNAERSINIEMENLEVGSCLVSLNVFVAKRSWNHGNISWENHQDVVHHWSLVLDSHPSQQQTTHFSSGDDSVQGIWWDIPPYKTQLPAPQAEDVSLLDPSQRWDSVETFAWHHHWPTLRYSGTSCFNALVAVFPAANLSVGCRVLRHSWFLICFIMFSDHAVQASQLMSFDKACWTLDNILFAQNLARTLAWVQMSVGQVRVLSRHMWVYPFFQTRCPQFHIKGSQKHTVSAPNPGSTDRDTSEALFEQKKMPTPLSAPEFVARFVALCCSPFWLLSEKMEKQRQVE